MKKVFAILASVVLLATTSTSAHAVSSTFYLKLKSNTCYSFTKAGNKPISIGNELKSMYAVSCSKPHHFQVIKTGIVPSVGAELSQADMEAYCWETFATRFGDTHPAVVKGTSLYLRWYFPDAGAETTKYGNKGICLIHTADADYTSYQVMKKKF